MRTALQERCNLFVQNRDIIKSALSWENSYIYPICAEIYASKGKLADPAHLKECKALLKENTGVLSNFRGTARMVITTKLSLAPDPAKLMEQMLTVYSSLKEVFFGSEYLVVTAAAIAELAEPDDYAKITKRTREVYNDMKSAHPFLTSGEDSVFAALLALSDLEDEFIEAEMERCYRLLKQSFSIGNAVQSLSHVLSLDARPAEEKCAKTAGIYDYLKKNGYKYGKHYELATLGVLALLEADIPTICDDIMQAADFLKTQKGFGAMSVGSRQRLMYAGMLTMDDYVPEADTMRAAALNGVVSLVIAQQIAICASAAAASAAAASAASS